MALQRSANSVEIDVTELPEDLGLSIHSRALRKRNLIILALLSITFLAPFPRLRNESFVGGVDLYLVSQTAGAVLGVLTGLAFALRFHALGNSLHLYIGLAFLVSGMQDFVHALLCLRFGPGGGPTIGIDLIRQTFVTGQTLIGATLLVALYLPAWFGVSSRERETVRISLIVLLLTTLAVVLPSQYSVSPTTFRYTELLPAALHLIALLSYFRRYQTRHDMLSWLILISLAINLISQFVMFFSTRNFDALFHLSQLYKTLGYLMPLVGFLSHQITVVQAYRSAQTDLIAAREAALAATRAKSEFLANMSHEIRTPMNGILGMTHQALKTPLTDYQKQCLNIVRQSSRSLLTLLNDVLDFSKIEAGKLELSPDDFPLERVVREAVNSVVGATHEKDLKLNVHVAPELPLWVRGDSVRLRQVLVNLVGNAIKFTQKGSIDVVVKPAPRERIHTSAPMNLADPRLVLFSVSDTGIGIPEDKHAAIFEAFSQVDGSITRRFGGTGLGLAISSQLVHLMGGQIWVESQVNTGSRFSFTVWLGAPVAPAPESASAPNIDLSANSPRSSRPAVILVAEDHPVNRQVVVALLEGMGHQVRIATDGAEAIARLESEAIDLALIDLQMPKLGGLEVAARFRETEKTRGQPGANRLPMLALTAHALPEHQQRCLEAGMDAVLTKPISEEELFVAIERQLSKAEEPAEPSAAGLRATASGCNGVDSTTPLNISRLWEQVGGDWTLFSEIRDLFRESSPGLLKELIDGLRDRDAERVTRAAHTLGGAAANFHATPFVATARELERVSSIGDLATAHSLADYLQQEYRRLESALTAIKSPPQNPVASR